MNDLQIEYLELAALTKQLIREEYPEGGWIATDAEVYASMKAFALQSGKKPAASPPPVSQRTPPAPAAKPPMRPQLKRAPLRQPEQPPEEAKPKQQADHSIEREAVSSLVVDDFSDIRKVLREKHPELHLHDSLPSDEKAREIQNRWKSRSGPEVLLLAFDRNEAHIPFLERLCRAIEEHYCAAEVGFADEWTQSRAEGVRLILASPQDMESHPEIFGQYLEGKLLGVPLLPLAPIEEYLKQPSLKAPLWKSIGEMLQG